MKLNSSVKTKLFLAICLIAVVFISVFSFLNLFFYDDYYIFSKKNTLADIYHKVNSIYDGDIGNIASELLRMEYVYGVRISIRNGDEIKYNTIFDLGKSQKGPLKMPGPMPAPRENSRFTYNQKELKERGYTFSTLQDTPGKNQFLGLIGKLKNNDRLVAIIPVAFIEETSHFTSFFLLIAGLFTLLVCVVLAYFLSKCFSAPLIEINDVATSMATLDFSKKYTGKSRDEIGQLGNSVNKLSFHLQNAIDDLRRSNLLLAEEVRKERKIDEMRKDFIINVSHELKTPIAIVQGYAEGLKVNVNSSEEDKNYYCDIIIDESHRMNRLVMQLLDLSCIEAGSEKPEMVGIDLQSLAKSVVTKTKPLAEAKNLRVDYKNVSGAIMGDFGMVEQALTNYVTNAIKNTPENGSVTLYSELKPGAVRMSVENEGSPIPEEELQKIWEKFYKVDKSRSRADGGTGIGLSIVRAVMEAHGGAYGAYNLDKSTVFYFELKSAAEE
ncbi:MAG: HAMP domain-containing sensor histidine kinase [Bacillota bacterium]|nr:HAMP domain-containing sensor histidine kinase [Bacillota bacterium]